mgnify:CR=1 FL=1
MKIELGMDYCCSSLVLIEGKLSHLDYWQQRQWPETEGVQGKEEQLKARKTGIFMRHGNQEQPPLDEREQVEEGRI